jgi:4-hydroxybenzoate polyprenyltransferase
MLEHDGSLTWLVRESSCLVFVMVCGLSVLVLYLHDRQQCCEALGNLRWERVLHYLGLLALGVYMSASRLPPVAVLMAAALAVCLAWGSAVANNDLVDVDIDRWSNPGRPLVVGSWNSRSFSLLALAQGALALAGAYCVNGTFAVCILIFLAVAFIYSTPPLRLKKYLGLSTGLIAFASLIVALAGFICSGERSFTQFPAPVAWYCLIALTCGVNFKDIKDYEGDRRAGMQTMVTVFGLRRGKWIIAVLVSAGFLSAPWIFGRADLWLPSVVFSAVAAFLITRNRFREKLLFMLYYGYFLVLIAAGLFRGQFAP